MVMDVRDAGVSGHMYHWVSTVIGLSGLKTSAYPVLHFIDVYRETGMTGYSKLDRVVHLIVYDEGLELR
jgi:hypothetical protein